MCNGLIGRSSAARPMAYRTVLLWLLTKPIKALAPIPNIPIIM
jgi:hypothetical protein